MNKASLKKALRAANKADADASQELIEQWRQAQRSLEAEQAERRAGLLTEIAELAEIADASSNRLYRESYDAQLKASCLAIAGVLLRLRDDRLRDVLKGSIDAIDKKVEVELDNYGGVASDFLFVALRDLRGTELTARVNELFATHVDKDILPDVTVTRRGASFGDPIIVLSIPVL